MDDVPVAVRSSAAGRGQPEKGLCRGCRTPTLNIVGPDTCLEAYHWDCASAYNLRSMTYRLREAILDAITKAEETGNDAIAENAKKEWAIEHTSLSVCLMRMINPVISGTAFFPLTRPPAAAATDSQRPGLHRRQLRPWRSGCRRHGDA